MTLRQLTGHPAIKGIALRSCAEQDGPSANEIAACDVLAHAHYGGEYQGWICIRNLRDYNATTLRHEIAHLVRGNKRHDEAWRQQVRVLGGRIQEKT